MKSTALTKNICTHNKIKKYTEDAFLSLAPWDTYKPKKNKSLVQVDDQFQLHFDSEDEKVIYEHIERNKLAKIIRGQALEVSMPKSKHSYYPDIIYLDQNNEVVVVEVKSKANMSTIDVLEKYQALQKFCYNKGFHYVMIDKNFTSMKSFCQLNYNKSLEEKIIQHIKQHGILDSNTVTAIRNKYFSHIKRKVLDKMITAIIIKNNYVDRKVNMTQLHVVNQKHFMFGLCRCESYLDS